MARLNPITVPKGIEVSIHDQTVTIKGSKGTLAHKVHSSVEVSATDNVVTLAARKGHAGALAQSGTAQALINNMVAGVSKGFEKKLQLVGVGYRAQAQGNKLNMTLGFSHPIDYELPEGVSVETPSQTEIILKGIDKQRVGQAAAEIRAFRPPEPYKGKGVKYADEHIVRKEAKKK